MPETEDDLLRERVRSMLDHCEISNVRVQDFSAERFDDHGAPSTARIESETSYLVNEHAFRNRYFWKAELVDNASTPVAKLSATMLVEYDIREGFEADPEAAEAIAGSSGFFAAYPYVRELFQSCTSRLELDPMVLGMLFAGSTSPRGVTLTRISDYGDGEPAAPAVDEELSPQ